MGERRRGSLLPLTYVFASFIGAALVAAVFAYNNYRFSQYKFVDFGSLIFYEKSEIFAPKNEKFTLVIFSSNMSEFDKLRQKLNPDLPVVAVDLFQKRLKSEENLSYVTSDINTILKLMSLLNIRELPSSVEMVHNGKQIYKQNSKINKI